MNAPLPDQLLEEEIRAMLHRRAQDVDPTPPSWRELAQRNGAVVISLRTGAPVDREAQRRRRRPGRQWFRGAVAAAVALILAMVAALLVQGSGPGGGDGRDGIVDAPEPIEVPAAGQADFDPVHATPLFPAVDDASTTIPQSRYLGDPRATAEEYLRSAGLPVGQDGMVVGDPARQATPSASAAGQDVRVQTATVSWALHAESLTDRPPVTQGTVFLRNATRDGRDTWMVVGAFTQSLAVTGIRNEGDRLSFTVDRSAETETFMNDPVEVWVDRDLVATVDYREVRPITFPHPADQVAIIKVQHVVAGEPLSVTATAVPASVSGR